MTPFLIIIPIGLREIKLETRNQTATKFQGNFIYHYFPLAEHEGRSYELTARFNPPTPDKFPTRSH